MKRKTEISLTMALLMVVSTFAVGAANVSINEDPQPTPFPFGEVVKEVFNGTCWVDCVEAELDDTLRFKITLTYYNTDHPNATYARDIVVVDTLPDCLIYANNATLGETDISGQVITWEIDGTLDDGQSIVIEFNATVVDYTSEVGEDNVVEVTALEKCSSRNLVGSDGATVIVLEDLCIPEIVVEKKVLVDDEWVDSIEDLHLGDVLTFKITVEYFCGEDTILCLEVYDYLPCCLEYENNLNLDASWDDLKDPVVEISSDNKTISVLWSGGDSYVEMKAGDSLVITFDVLVTNYCELIDSNHVDVYAWTCTGCEEEFYDYDDVEVNCSAPTPIFDKRVWNGTNWANEIETFTGDTLRFGLILTYFGTEELTDITFVDVLPCILDLPPTNIEVFPYDTEYNLTIDEETKTITIKLLNLTLHDSEMAGVKFDVVVNGTTGAGCCECEAAINYAEVLAKEGCTGEPNFFMNDELEIRSVANCPPTIPVIKGPHSGKVDEKLEFTMVSDDESGNITYHYNFGDSLGIITLEDQLPGVEVEISHIYTAAGTYYITARAEDVHGVISEIPDGFGFEVIITEEPPEEKLLHVSVKKFGIGRIGATVVNDDDVALYDIDWEISLTGGILGRVDVSNSGTIEELAVGGSQVIYTGGMMGAGSIKLTNFGKVNGEATATVGDTTKTVTFHGFVIGKLVLITGYDYDEE